MRMQIKGAALCGLLVSGLVVSSVSAEEEMMQPGQWEFEVWYNFVGVPQRFPSYTQVQCISEGEPIPDISRAGHECRQQLEGEFGRTYTWQLNCSTDWEMVHGMGRIHYWGERARGDVHLQVINPYNPPQPMVFHIKGQRLGECQSD